MKQNTKKIINIIGAMSLVFACVFGVALTTTNKTTIKASANNESDIVLNHILENDNHYLLPYETISEIKAQNDNVPYELLTLTDADYMPVVYVYGFYNDLSLGYFLRNISLTNYNCYTKIRIISHEDDGIDETYIFNTLRCDDYGEFMQVYFIEHNGNETMREFYDSSYMGTTYLIMGVSVRDNAPYQPLAHDLISSAYVYNVDSYGGMFETDYYNINNVASDGVNQNYLTYNIYPKITLPKDLKYNEYYLGDKALYLNYPYKRCEYTGENGIRYYVNDETGSISFLNPSISPNGKYLFYKIDDYDVVYNETTRVYYLHHTYGKDLNTITFIPTLENVLFYKYQGFNAYGNNGAYANFMPNTYFAFRNLAWSLSGQEGFWLDVYTQYNGTYYDRAFADAYFHDYGRQLIFRLYNDNSNIAIYEEVVDYVYGETNANEYSYETQLSNYVINVIEQPYTQDVYDFISFYTMGEVDKNTIIINPLTNETTSSDIIGGSGIFDLFGSAFNGIYSAFNVMVFPGVTLWALLMIPLVGVILLFIVKLFKR